MPATSPLWDFAAGVGVALGEAVTVVVPAMLLAVAEVEVEVEVEADVDDDVETAVSRIMAPATGIGIWKICAVSLQHAYIVSVPTSDSGSQQLRGTSQPGHLEIASWPWTY